MATIWRSHSLLLLDRIGQRSLRSAHATLYTAAATTLLTTMRMVQRTCQSLRIALDTHSLLLCDLMTASCFVLLLLLFLLQWIAAQAETTLARGFH